jgi:Na+-translocating ferredoxin:NAD+ oxidoreductase subunit G
VDQATEPGSIRLAGTLAIAGLLSGLALVAVYLATKPLIQENRAEALRQAIYKVLPGTAEIEPFALKGGKLVPFPGKPGAPTDEQVIYQGLTKDGATVGYAIPAEGAGFQDTVKLLYGYDPARDAVVGMEVLESRETPGLGDKIAFDPHFKQNFEELKLAPTIQLVKKGEKTQPNQVDIISGATISCRAVVNILNQSTQHWTPIVKQGPGLETARVQKEAE